MFLDLRSLFETTVSSDEAMSRGSTPWMPPPLPRPSPSLFTIAASLILPILASTLAVAAPFTPARTSMPVSFETPKAKMASMYRPVPTSEFAPFAQREWVNPQKPGPAISEVRGLNLPLIGTIPFRQTNWPNPGKPSSPIAEVRGLTLSLLPSGKPFIQTHWINPAGPKQLPAPSSFRPVFTSEFQPFNQTQWPNPGKPAAPFSEVRGLNLSLLPAQNAPFKQLTWGVPPRPIVPPPPSIYRPQADQAAVDRPFVQTNWPNPILPPRTRMPQPEQYFEAVYKPVMQNDWPLPWYPPRFKHDVIGFNRTLIPVSPEAPHPFAQLDWPLPKLPPVYVHPVGPWMIVTLTTPATPNLDKLLYDVDTGVWYMRVNATSQEIIRIT